MNHRPYFQQTGRNQAVIGYEMVGDIKIIQSRETCENNSADKTCDADIEGNIFFSQVRVIVTQNR